MSKLDIYTIQKISEKCDYKTQIILSRSCKIFNQYINTSTISLPYNTLDSYFNINLPSFDLQCETDKDICWVKNIGTMMLNRLDINTIINEFDKLYKKYCEEWKHLTKIK
jgi:hypothetical protein